MRFSIKAKLAAGFGVMLILVGLAGWVGYYKLVNTDAALQYVLGRADLNTLALEAKSDLFNAISLTRAAVIAVDDDQMAVFAKQAAERRSAVQAKLSKIKDQIDTEKGLRLYDEVKGRLEKQAVIAGQVVTLTQVNSNVRTWTEIETVGIPALRALQADLEAVSAKAGTDAGVARAVAAFQIQIERAWGGLKATTGAISYPALEQHVKAARTLESNLAPSLDALLRALAESKHGMAGDHSQGPPVRPSFDLWIASFRKALATVENGATIRAADLAAGDYVTASTATLQAIDALAQYETQQMADAAEHARVETRDGRTILIATVAGALLLGFIIATWLAVSIARGLLRAVSLAEAVAVGDLGTTITVTSRDEIGDLVAALNRMTASLNDTAAIANAIAAGDLTVEARPLSDRDSMGRALQTMLGKLRAIVADASVAAGNVSAGSQELSASAEQLSQGSTEQAASTEEASASMEEMAANVKQNAENASQTETIARQSAKDAEASGAAVGRAVDAMQTIAQKITIVQEIARQTDLLALERRRGGGPRRGARPGFRGGGVRGEEARRAQPSGGRRDRDPVLRHGQGGPAGRRDARAAGARHPQDRAAGGGDLRGVPGAGCRLGPDQPGDPAARQGDPAERQRIPAGLGDLRGAGDPGRAASGDHRLLPHRGGGSRVATPRPHSCGRRQPGWPCRPGPQPSTAPSGALRSRWPRSRASS